MLYPSVTDSFSFPLPHLKAPRTHPHNPGWSWCFKANRLAALAPSGTLISPCHLMQHIHSFQWLGHGSWGPVTGHYSSHHSELQGLCDLVLFTSLTSRPTTFPPASFTGLAIKYICLICLLLGDLPWYFHFPKDLHSYLPHLLQTFAQKWPSQ